MPFARIIRNTPVCMYGVDAAAAGGVASAGNTRYTSTAISLSAAACCMLLLMLPLLLLRPCSLWWCWYNPNSIQHYLLPVFKVDVRVPLHAACVLSLLLLLLSITILLLYFLFAVTLLAAAAGSLSMLLPPPSSLLLQLAKGTAHFLLRPLMLYPHLVRDVAYCPQIKSDIYVQRHQRTRRVHPDCSSHHSHREIQMMWSQDSETDKPKNQCLRASPQLAVYPSVTENRHCPAYCQQQQLSSTSIDHSTGRTHS